MTYIFLDENKWIDLRRFIFKENNCPDLSAVVKLLERKVTSNEWVLPLSLEHITETQSTLTPTLRTKLISVMVVYSDGYTIKDFVALKDYEINELLSEHNPWESPEAVIVRDSGNIFGKSIIERVDNILDEEQIALTAEERERIISIYSAYSQSGISLEFLMNQQMNIDDIAQSKEIQASTLERLRVEGISEGFQSDKRSMELLFVFNRLKDYYTTDQQLKIMSYIMSTLPRGNKQKARNVLTSILQRLPTFYTNCILIYKYIKMHPKNLPFHKNDFLDLMYLAAMIPYCDVVVTEKKWVDLAHQAKLDKLYNTKLFCNIQQLLEL